MTASPAYTLLDPRPVAAEAPYTFFLPGQAEVAAVGPGDGAKLMFAYPHQVEEWSVERMWVLVQTVEGDHLTGRLDNVPAEPTAPLRAGDVVRFRREQIIAIDWARPEQAPEPVARRGYWQRCLVDACVLEGEMPVGFLYRESPDMTEAGDADPDSGWRIRGRMDDASDAEIDAREARYVALGAVLNRDDSWLELIDAPVGACFRRNVATGAYEPQPDG